MITISCVSYILLIACFAVALGSVQDPRFLTTCTFAGPDVESSHQHDCHVALFSNKNIQFTGNIVAVEHDLCSLEFLEESTKRIQSLNLAVLVKRGKCSFATKAKTAQEAGFKLVIIANTEEEGFPVGPPELEFALEVPAMMVGQKVWDEVAVPGTERLIMEYMNVGANVAELVSQISALNTVSVHFAPHVPPQAAAPAQGNSPYNKVEQHPAAVLNVAIVCVLFATAAAIAVLVLVLVFYSTVQHHLSATHHSRPTQESANSTTAPTTYTTYLVQLLVYALIIVVFVAMRLGTLRIYSTTNSGDVVYNHKETDERVFEALVHNVLADPWDYRLHPHTIQELQLAEENYSDTVFIHPPLFVYTSAALLKYCNVVLPLVPILLQVVTLCLLPVICTCVLGSIKYVHVVDNIVHYRAYFSDGEVYNIGVLSMLLLSSCPIAAFSSQKFWIDNCLMMSVTVCVAAHVVLLHRSDGVESGVDKSIAGSTSVGVTVPVSLKHALSGLVFGLIGLNCKITAAALVLFCVGYIILQQFTHYTECYHYLTNKGKMSHRKHTTLLRGTVVPVVVYCAVFGLCAALASAPWMYIYWINTGRLAPNAWPSATMLQRSSFVRSAVLKPWYTYCFTLLTIAPVHVVGVVGVVVAGLCSVRSVLCGVVYGVGVLWGSSADSDVSGTQSTTGTATGATADRTSSLRRRTTATTDTTGSADSATTADTKLASTPTITTTTAHTTPANTTVDPVLLTILVLALWPVGFLVGLTFLGSLGSGFQSRFLMPMLPGSAILSAVCVVWVQRTVRTVSGDGVRRRGDMHSRKVLSVACVTVLLLCMMYSMVHVLYYGVLYAPLFADLDVNMVDIVCGVLESAYFPPDSRESFQATLKFMSHFGLVRDSK